MALPPPSARCDSCYWAREFLAPRLHHEAGREVPKWTEALFCCYERPRIETLAESVCPDWVTREQSAEAPPL